jgi:hypothetical protein
MAYSLDGRIASEKFTTRMLFHTTAAPSDEAIYKLGDDFVNLVKPLLASRVEIYATTISPIAAPGEAKRTRNDHITRYFDQPGTYALAAGKDPALLEVCAQFFKYSTRGTAGEILIRGVLSEDDLQSDKAAGPENVNDAANARFEAFGAPTLALFRALGGKGLVMPGPKFTDKGVPIPLAAYDASARQVMKVEFDGFTQRQVKKSTESIEGKTIDLMHAMVNKLRRQYNLALKDADFVAGAIAAENQKDLNDLGHDIFVKFNAAERQKINAPTFVKAYIR